MVADEQKSTAPEHFDLAKHVHQYLSSEGFKISLRGLYNHIQERKLKKSPDGKFTREAVERYAARFLPRLDGSNSNKHVEGLQQEKLQADVRRAIEDARLKRLRADLLDGKLVPASAFEQGLAARAALLKRGLQSMCHGVVERCIEAVGGDSTKAPHLLDLLLSEVRNCLDQYAHDREFTVDREEVDSFLQAAKARETA